MKEEKENIESDKIILKELFESIKEYFDEIIKNWILIIILALPMSFYMMYKVYKTPITYPATLTFMMNENEGGSGGISGLINSFGFGGGGNDYNLEKMLALLISRNVIQQALFENIEHKGKEDFLVNHIIDDYNYHEKWKENEQFKNFKFKNSEIDSFSRIENSVLKQIYGKIKGNGESTGILTSSIDNKTGIISIKTKTFSEEMSINLAEVLFSKLEKFYVDKAIEGQQSTFDLIKSKVDSIREALNYTQYSLLKKMDTDRNLSLRQYQAEEYKLQRELQALASAYAEAIKNQETADFALRSKKPFIQVIDFPIPPIPAVNSAGTYFRNFIMGSLLGGFLGAIFIIGRKFYRDSLT